jgi:T3SS negative regulator,GrlR
MKKPPPGYAKMKNGLYSVHIQMGDGVKGRASGVIVLRDGVILGGDPYFWSVGSYTAGAGTWKGDLVTRPIAAARRGRFLPDGRSRQAFPEHSGVTIPRFSAPRW